jgi:hypothetical protein
MWSFKPSNTMHAILIFTIFILIGYLFVEINMYKSLYQTEIQKTTQLIETIEELNSNVDNLSRRLDTLENIEILYNIEKLKDRSFTSIYGDGYTWYTAAENLGKIGKPAIPYLINKLETKDSYEKSLVLHALLLSSQHENVKVFTGGDYIRTTLGFSVEDHDEMTEIAYKWWEKYKDNW